MHPEISSVPNYTVYSTTYMYVHPSYTKGFSHLGEYTFQLHTLPKYNYTGNPNYTVYPNTLTIHPGISPLMSSGAPQFETT